LLEIEFDAQGRRAGKLLTYQQIADKFEIDVGEVRAMVRR
jgi:DNA-directed RNA polymerase specialized sigma24 family protein